MDSERETQSGQFGDLAKALPALATQYDVFRFLKTVAERYRMRAFLVSRMPDATSQTLQSLSIISSWPADLLTRHDQQGRVGTNPIAVRLRSTTIPFTLDLDSLRNEGGWADLVELLTPYHMQRLAIFPVSDPEGERGVVSLYGDRAPMTAQEMLELTMLSIQVYERLYQLGRREAKAGEDLTEREIDCLTWTAAGKTSSEISEIVGLSEHTVNHYLNRATRKLNTVNRTQAVAKAIRTGIIS
jgi:DNA-binding CsgD family transcriptional regulator